MWYMRLNTICSSSQHQANNHHCGDDLAAAYFWILLLVVHDVAECDFVNNHVKQVGAVTGFCESVLDSSFTNAITVSNTVIFQSVNLSHSMLI